MKKAVSILLVAVMLVSLLAISSFAAPADFTLQGQTVELADEDVTIEVPIITSHGDFYYGLECTWEADAPLELVGFTPNDKETNGYAGLISVSVADQKVVWMDTAFIGTEIESGAAVWTATYKVPKDTAAGTYNVKVNIAQITSLENDMESDIELNATITVKGGELPPAPTPEHHEAKDATCTEPGNVEYYVDTETGKLYADIEGTTEITEADTVIPALGHDWGVWKEQADGSMVRTCSRCGEIETLTAGPVEPPVTPVTPVIPSRPTTYTLSFETNGGSAIEAVTANANQEVFLASFVPTCEGKTFYGWFTEAELTNKVDKIALSKDTTVYAFWLPFSDIPADAWYIDEVAQLKPLGLLDGFETAEFKGDEQTTRGMIVTTLYALAGAPEVTGEMAFNDVAEDNFSYKAVIWATENGIAKGYGDGTFKPDQSVSRQELVCFLYRYAAFKGLDVTGRADLSAYTDAAQVASWAAEEMAWAVNAGLVKGMSDTVLQPAGTGTHAQWAALLVRVAAFGK